MSMCECKQEYTYVKMKCSRGQVCCGVKVWYTGCIHLCVCVCVFMCVFMYVHVCMCKARVHLHAFVKV